MDPITAALNIANTALQLLRDIRNDLPEDARKQGAADAAKMVHNIMEFVLSLQGKINAAIVKA